MITPSLIRAILEENSVIITGFGKFFVKKLSSQIKEDVIYPPQNIIEFEHSKEIEGGDFVNKFSQWEQLNTDEAQSKVFEWFHLIEQGLVYNKSVFFDNFGTFSKDDSGQIVFQSMLIPELNIENEGFEPIYMPPKEKKQNHQNMEEAVQDKRIVLTKKKKKRDTFWFATAIIVTILLLVALFLKDRIIDFYQTTFAKSEVAVVMENNETSDTEYINDVKEEDVNETVIVETHDQEININMSSDGIYLPYQKGKYYVIAGSFAKEEDALRHIQEKKLEKYHAKLIVQPQNPRKRVCIGVFNTEKDANNFAAQIDKNYWILK